MKAFLPILFALVIACSAARAETDPEPVLTPSEVRINRTVPAVTPPPAAWTFRATPSDEEISSASVLAEPLLPLGKTTPAGNRALAQALVAYGRKQKRDDFSALTAFLQKHPASPWRASLLANLGLAYYQTGRFSQALSAWEEAWKLAQADASAAAGPVGDLAASELAKMLARIGRFDKLTPLLKQLERRDVLGSARDKIVGAREGLWLMENLPEKAFRCGPLAVSRILMALGRPEAAWRGAVEKSHSTQAGISLADVAKLAQETGAGMRMAKRRPGSDLPLPALVHWKVGHYAALIRRDNGLILIQDPTFGDDLWISPEALDSEASGYFLVAAGKLPAGWSPVGDEEGGEVFGKGNTGSDDPTRTSASDVKAKGCPGSTGGDDEGVGMPVYNFHVLLASLNLVDVPLRYAPPVGPAVKFRITYNHREAGQPATFNYSNLGQKWTFDWMSYVTDDPTVPSADAHVYMPGGGTSRFTGYDAATRTYANQRDDQSVLVRTSTSPVAYERRLKDGSREIFAQSNGAAAYPRKVFLTQVIDPAGNALAFTYDASLRLVSARDAIGQVTTLAYGLAADIRKVTRVTDPFGRFTTLEYDGSGRLSKVTDMIGLATTFAYGTGNFVNSMTTPYGTTSFSYSENFPSGRRRVITATDPLGRSERLDFRQDAPGIPTIDPVAPPPEFAGSNSHLHDPTAYYWDKRAAELYGYDYSKSVMYHFLRTQDQAVAGHLLRAIKLPLENRIWYNYTGQVYDVVMNDGMQATPREIGRTLSDGTFQVSRFEHNAMGHPTKVTDPLGRATTFTYAANLQDLLTVRQTTGTQNELLLTYTWNAQHLPLTVKDASGQVTTYTYNARGQLLTERNARNETTTYTYDANGYLTRIAGPPSGSNTDYTYDGFGRVRTATSPDGYRLTYDYDAFDRVTKVTYPDNTFDQFVYAKLDLERSRDRRGLWTRFFYNLDRQPNGIRDPQGRTTSMEWCGCGDIESLVDPLGRKTSWSRDEQGRVVEKVFPDGKKEKYAYETATSRIRSVTDARNQAANFEWFLDDNLKRVSYSGAVIATPAVSYTYDAQYDRPKTMVDGTGTTTYNYNAITATPALGAGRLANVDGPLSNDVIAFTYDALGRVAGRSINGNASSWAYDNLGRVTTAVNALGTFTHKYVGHTGRLDSLLYPNGQKTKFTYHPNTGDFLLSEIKNLTPAAAALSKWNYAYDKAGQIKTWTQQAGTATAMIHEFAYDRADQLVAAIVKSAATGNPVQKHSSWAYDAAGNRTSAQDGNTVNTTAYNSLNQATSQSAGGRMRFHGTLSEGGSATVAGQPAPGAADNQFDGQAAVVSGSNTVTVVAKDHTNNSRTVKYQVSASGSAKTYTYDANGNLSGDGTRTYEWDAEDRLVAVVQGTLRSEFTYDGLDRRVRIVEKNGATVTSDRRFLWVGNEIAEERDAAGGTVAKRHYPDGVMVGSTKYFYTRDHLGSIREMTDNAGAVQARYEYDAWGTRTRVAGTMDADFGYTGHYHHAQSGLVLAKYRAFSPGMGRWISRDPIEEGDGVNLYAYVGSDPFNYFDEHGLSKRRVPRNSNQPSFGRPPGQTRPKGQPKGGGLADALPPSCPTYRDPKTGEPPPRNEPVPPIGGYLPKPNPNPRPPNTANNHGGGTIFVDSRGNAIPTPPGGRITGSPDGRFIQARDPSGRPTGVRKDGGGHPPGSHPDPRSQAPHGHVPGVSNKDGTPWLPIK